MLNPFLASLFPGMFAAVFGAMYLGYWAFVLGLVYSLVYFGAYLLIQSILRKQSLNKSLIATVTASTLLPFSIALCVMVLIGGTNALVSAATFAVLGFSGGIYLGYLNKTS